MNKPLSDQLGRPLTFDPEKVLFEILNVFWEKGYDHTSVGDLETATGLTRPSLYNTFGNKRVMYEKSIELYLAKMETFIGTSLTNGSNGLEDLIGFVDTLIESFHDETYAAGCAILNAMAAHGELDVFAANSARVYREQLLAGITATVERAVAAGEVPERELEVLVDRMHLYLVGLNILTRHNDTFERIVLSAEAIKSDIRAWAQK